MLEPIVNYFAPTRCIACQKVGVVLCESCMANLPSPISRCYRCHKHTNQFQVCSSCRKKVSLKHVWVVADFSGTPKDLVHLFKFERLSSVSGVLAEEMANILPLVSEDTIICHIPTASSRIRTRGFDQTNLIAKKLAKLTGLKKQTLLRRTSSHRQVGSSRKDRFTQAQNSYQVINPASLYGKNILLVDDVSTSGATIESVADLLKKSGAKSISAIIYAQAID